jgi:Mlc titration factor MtfA (ptsG expression regulator)
MDLGTAMIGLLPPLLVVGAFFGYRYYKQWRLKRIQEQPFPEKWLQTMVIAVPLYPRLSGQEQERLQQLIKQFLADKEFYGCDGLELTDEIRITIAAQACLLLLNKTGGVYPKLSSILVYPTGFIAERDVHHEDGTVSKNAHHLLGESWDNGRIVLSWDDVEHGAADFGDGYNVVLHEFAHQLDSESGSTNGAPILRHNSYKTWASVFSEHYDDLQSRVARGKPTVIDDYGTTNPAEFFAVATETFFENPGELQAHRPQLYDELKDYYRCDPREWHD